MKQGREASVIRLYSRLAADPQITAWNISLFMAICYRWYHQAQQNPVAVTRRSLMQLARMQSCMTYHKCISQLHQLGYICYTPSFHPRQASRILIIF